MKQTTIRVSLCTIAVLASRSFAAAEQDSDEAEQRRGAVQTIKLTDLAEPPAPLAALIEQGTVKFFVGQLPSGRKAENLPGEENKLRFTAETQFNMNFDYRSRTQWRVQRSAGKAKLVINVLFPQVELKQTHDVWFQRRPATDGFWTNRLVLHEFDHVRLSSDPRIEKRFAQRLRDSKVITKLVDANARINDAVVRRVVDEHVKQVFAEILELVKVRNQELDRQTNHGVRPLPEDSTLSEWLR
jgi:hypothetical protein